MEPISTLGGYLAGKAIDTLSSRFKTSVIERWSQQRAKAFVQAFCQKVVETWGVETGDDGRLESYLNDILQDEQKSAALFDAYRRVALAASPEIGPRVIALVTAKLVAENRSASADEEGVLAAAERLTDDELRQVKREFSRYVSRMKQRNGFYVDETNADNTAGTDYWNDIGPWAGKLASLGLVSDYSQLRERSLDYGEQPRYELITYMSYAPAFALLAKLVEKAEPKSS